MASAQPWNGFGSGRGGQTGQEQPTVAHLAALAGVSESTTRNALREGETLGLVGIDQRRRNLWINHPNDVQVQSREWMSWLRIRIGAKSHTPNPLWRTKEGFRLGGEFCKIGSDRDSQGC